MLSLRAPARNWHAPGRPRAGTGLSPLSISTLIAVPEPSQNESCWGCFDFARSSEPSFDTGTLPRAIVSEAARDALGAVPGMDRTAILAAPRRGNAKIRAGELSSTSSANDSRTGLSQI
jgi:hypothetical protein